MPIELKIPEVGESITEVEIGGWLKPQGQEVRKDEPLVTLESEKATVELPAPEAGTLAKVLKQQGETAKVGEVIGYIEPSGAKAEPKEAPHRTEAKEPRASVPPPKTQPKPEKSEPKKRSDAEPPAEKQLREPREQIPKPQTKNVEQEKPAAAPPTTVAKGFISSGDSQRVEESVPMSPLRRTVAQRLVEARQNAALLTTFNEIDMSEVIALRKEYGEAFQEKYKVKLGFMSFFVKASIEALKEFPVINAEARDTNIVYHNYFDIGIAVGSGKGLVVPVIRNAEAMSFSEIEIAIRAFAARAKENKLKLEELRGGTFTISNGGTYGSLLSTPIVNPPQSGVLGLHAIQDRPVARDGNVVIRSMMYVALTYDHRIVDGREAVFFLRRIKEIIEKPARMLLEI